MRSLFNFSLIPLVLMQPIYAQVTLGSSLLGFDAQVVGTLTGLTNPQSLSIYEVTGAFINNDFTVINTFNAPTAVISGTITPPPGTTANKAAIGSYQVGVMGLGNGDFQRFYPATGYPYGLSTSLNGQPAALAINEDTFVFGLLPTNESASIKIYDYYSGNLINSFTVTGQPNGIALKENDIFVASAEYGAPSNTKGYLTWFDRSSNTKYSSMIGSYSEAVAYNGTIVAASNSYDGVKLYNPVIGVGLQQVGTLTDAGTICPSVAMYGTVGAATDITNNRILFFNTESPYSTIQTLSAQVPVAVVLGSVYGAYKNYPDQNIIIFSTQAAPPPVGPPQFQLNNGAWSSGASWDTGVAPTLSDQAIMPEAGAPWTADLTASGVAQYVSCLGMTILQGNGGILTLNPSTGFVFDIQRQTELTSSLRVDLISDGGINLVDALIFSSSSMQKQNNADTINVTIDGTGTLSITNNSNFDYQSDPSFAFSSIAVTGEGNLNVDNTSTFGRYAQILTLDGPIVQNSGLLGSNAQNITFNSGTMTNNGTCAYAAGGVTVFGGSITNTNSFAEGDVATITLTGGKIINSGNFASKTVALGSKPVIVSSQNPAIISETVMAVNLLGPDYKKLNTESIWLDNQESYELQVENLFGNQALMASNLKALNQYCPPSTQAVIDKIFSLKDTDFSQALTELTPVFKIAQFSLEKLDLLIHKDLNIAFENEDVKNSVFVTAGYDNLNQSKKSHYHGYDVSSFYQLLGVRVDRSNIKYLAGLGAAESSMDVNGVKAHAHYNTVYATLGLGSRFKKLSYSCDALFGYSFFDGQRKIQFLDASISNHHNIYNISFDAELVYDVTFKNCELKPYNQLSYLWGQEDGYKEKGSSGVNLKVWDENISVLRNAFGFMFNVPKDSSVKGFVDLAWLYEWYIHSNTFKASILGTDAENVFEQGLPTKNYGRVRAGLMGSHKQLSWQLTYAGLFGEKFLENTASVRLGYKF